MSNILLVTSSPRTGESVSTKVAAEFAEKLKNASSGNSLVHRDLGSDPIPHLDTVSTAAIRKPAADRSADEAVAAAVSDTMVAELLAADTVIIATGLINFSIYSSLKSWIDSIARAGMTFKYSEAGPQGLVTGKKVYVVLASAGVYSEGPAASLNHATPYLKTVLGFMGMTDVEFIYVEGLAFGPEAVAKAMSAANDRIAVLAAA